MMEKDGRSVPLYLERNSLRVEAHVLQRASRPGNVAAGTDTADEHMEDVDVKESLASSSGEPAAEPSAEVAKVPAPVLKTWSSIQELHSRLRELGAPTFGTKDVPFRRLCECQHIAAKKQEEEEYLESRRKELAVATEPVTPKIFPGPVQPSEVERQLHMVNHLPLAPWCGEDDPSILKS